MIGIIKIYARSVRAVVYGFKKNRRVVREYDVIAAHKRCDFPYGIADVCLSVFRRVPNVNEHDEEKSYEREYPFYRF